MNYQEYQDARNKLLEQWDNDPDESLDDFDKWLVAKVTTYEFAFVKIESHCQQAYQASLKEQLSITNAAFILGAILGVVHKALGKELED